MRVGFIGCGNMAKALISGMISSKVISSDSIIASDSYKEGLEKAKKELKINTTLDNKEIVREADIIFLAIKPQFYNSVIEEIAPIIAEEKEKNREIIIVTLAPGHTLEKLEKEFKIPVKIIRTMPNTPAMVGEGMTALCKNNLITENELEYVSSLLKGCGKVEVVSEYMINSVIAVSGSSPAYVFIMIEAMADAAVIHGMPRDKAYIFAAQALLGSAKMLLETGMHPGQLKDMVCSPGGTTIEAVRSLEKTGFRSSIIEAMNDCVEKAKKM